MNPLIVWFKSAIGIAASVILLAAFLAYSWKIYRWGGASARSDLLNYQIATKEAVRLGVAAADKRAEEGRAEASAARAEAAASQAEFNKTLKAKQNELRKVTANLVVCKLNADTVRLLNDAARAATASQN